MDIPTTAIEGEQLVIRIPFAYLPTAMDCALDSGHVSVETKVTDPASFAKALLSELQEEKEDGTTLVHGLLDMAIEAAVDNGAEGIAEVAAGDEDDEE